MRNELFSLDPTTANAAIPMREALMSAVSYGHTVAITGTKRNSTERFSRVGTVIAFGGAIGMSSEVVLLDTAQGTRSFNVWLIDSVTEVD